MDATDKYVRMLILAAQIKVLETLPHCTVYKSDDKLDGPTQKSATLMDDVLKIRNEKMIELLHLDGSVQIKKLKNTISELTDTITGLEANK